MLTYYIIFFYRKEEETELFHTLQYKYDLKIMLLII